MEPQDHHSAGTATANVIRTLHGKPQVELGEGEGLPVTSLRQRRATLRRLAEGSAEGGSSSGRNAQADGGEEVRCSEVARQETSSVQGCAC